LLCKNDRHDLRTAGDRTAQGECQHCFDDRQARFHTKRKDGAAIVTAAETKGVTARDALEFIVSAPPEMLRHWQKLDPWAMREIRRILSEAR
jgi:hypothetical protein